MTAQDIITSAMRLFVGIDAGGTPSASELADGLVTLNDMLDSWSAERLNIYTYLTAAYSLVSATAAYTIGTTGTLTASARPTRIITAGILIPNAAGAGKLRFPLRILREDQWADETQERATAAVVPKLLYYDNGFPLGTLNLWPTPTFTGTAQIELYTLQPLAAFADQTTPLNFPPGYARTLRYNLAVAYAPEFGKEVKATVVTIANESKAGLRALNLASLTGQDPAAGQVNAIAPTPGE